MKSRRNLMIRSWLYLITLGPVCNLGKGKELFLAHFITKPPDFDQVLTVSVVDRSFTDEEFGKGLRVVFGGPNSIAQRLRGKPEAVGEIQGLGRDSGQLKVNVSHPDYALRMGKRVFSAGPKTLEISPHSENALDLAAFPTKKGG